MRLFLRYLIILFLSALIIIFHKNFMFYLLFAILILFIILFTIEDLYYKKQIYSIFSEIIQNHKLPEKIIKLKGTFHGLEELIIMLYDELLYKHYELREIALRDPLTKFYNLLYLEENLKDILSTFRRDLIPIFMIDIDKFKDINDNFGHITGDHFLKEFSYEMRNFLIDSKNLIFRYGGDEFVIFFDEDFDKAKNLIEGFRKSMEIKYFLIEDKKIKTTISAGGEVFKWEELKNIKEVLKKLDKKLYKAKEKRNTLYI